jgi:hypothetical protein
LVVDLEGVHLEAEDQVTEARDMADRVMVARPRTELIGLRIIEPEDAREGAFDGSLMRVIFGSRSVSSMIIF